MSQAPWTEIGELQKEVGDLKNILERKPDSSVIVSLKDRISQLEFIIEVLTREIDDLSSQIEHL